MRRKARRAGLRAGGGERTDGPILDPAWTVGALTLEDVVLAYLSPAEVGRPTLEVAR